MICRNTLIFKLDEKPIATDFNDVHIDSINEIQNISDNVVDDLNLSNNNYETVGSLTEFEVVTISKL